MPVQRLVDQPKTLGVFLVKPDQEEMQARAKNPKNQLGTSWYNPCLFMDFWAAPVGSSRYQLQIFESSGRWTRWTRWTRCGSQMDVFQPYNDEGTLSEANRAKSQGVNKDGTDGSFEHISSMYVTMIFNEHYVTFSIIFNVFIVIVL